MKNNFHKLVLVTQKLEKNSDEYLNFIKTCIQNGVTAVQLREKNLSYANIVSLSLRLKKLLSIFKIPLIINDNLKLALKINADGLHLGQNDGDIIQARKSLGTNKILGLTVTSIPELMKANELPIDYVGIGAIFPTKNKPNVKNIWGCHNLKEAITKSSHKVIAIGGINLTNAQDVWNTGVHGIAAIGAFHDSTNPSLTTRKLSNLVQNEVENVK
ncbi:MAG: thiamine phosphate synthase [Rickettsiales bacterium]|nr:thiamine phosphate synthase [Rickettsiales bacterium]